MKLMPCICTILCATGAAASPLQTVHQIRNSVVVKNTGDILTKLVIMLPLAQTNQYQTVSTVSMDDGTVVDIPKTDDKYLRWTFTSELPAAGGSKEIFYTFDVTLHAINFDFSAISTLRPYDTSSNTWKWHTGASGVYVDPNNPSVQHIGDSIWSRSSDIVDYARQCYLFVAERYSYLNPNTGIHPLQDILDAGGGNCGNLTSIYVSLLRHKKIPSRHIVTVRPDGSYHVWSDFYLESYGWIPVDVTYKNSNPSGDYFGKYDGTGIVMTKGVALQMDRGDGFTYSAALLQTYEWWYWCSTAGNSVSSSHRISSVATAAWRPYRSTSGGIFKCTAQNGLLSCGRNPARLFNLKGQLLARLHFPAPASAVSTLPGLYAIKVTRGENPPAEWVLAR
jgi:transglutaminase-like putative cysteine protease